MSLTVKQKKVNNIPPIDASNYMAVLIGIIDLGEQYSEHYKKYASEVLFIFEIPSLVIDIDGELKPRWLSKKFTASLNAKANLYKTLVSFLGRDLTATELAEDGTGFDLTSLAGKGCIITVTVDENETTGEKYNSIQQISGIPVGIPSPESKSEILVFDIDNRNDEVFGKLPEWIQERIQKSTQYQTNLPDQAVTLPEGAAAPTSAPMADPPKAGGGVNPI